MMFTILGICVIGMALYIGIHIAIVAVTLMGWLMLLGICVYIIARLAIACGYINVSIKKSKR